MAQAGQAGTKKPFKKIPNGLKNDQRIKTSNGNIIDEKANGWFCLKLLYQIFYQNHGKHFAKIRWSFFYPLAIKLETFESRMKFL